jgi:hypothetical protein
MMIFLYAPLVEKKRPGDVERWRSSKLEEVLNLRLIQIRRNTMGTSTFFINKINGEKDIQSLEQYLSTIPGIERVLMDTADNELKVVFNEKEIEQKYIVEQIEGQGFQIQ